MRCRYQEDFVLKMTDARYPESGESPVKLVAEDGEDLTMVSTLLQDAIFSHEDMSYFPDRRELAILFNRFRWEFECIRDDVNQPTERVRTILLVKDVIRLEDNLEPVPGRQVPYNLLVMEFEPTRECEGIVHLQLSGNWDINVHVECINLTLTDVTLPYVSPSGRKPAHSG